MRGEADIAWRVAAARDDLRAADALIEDYLPFIRAETARALLRLPALERDDALSVAMIAFHEAIRGYKAGRGAFLPYAALVIRSRLANYRRALRRQQAALSLDAPVLKDGGTLAETLADAHNEVEELLTREATREEIEQLTQELAGFGVTLADAADNCPRQQRTLSACRRALRHARENPELLEELLRTRRLPLSRLALGAGAERKTLERHRNYLVALLLIYTNGYELLRGHLVHLTREEAAE